LGITLHCQAILPCNNPIKPNKEFIMRKALQIAATFALVVTATPAFAQDGSDKFDSEEDRISYAIGKISGKNLKGLPFEINMDLFNKAINAEVTGGESLLNDAELQATMMALQQKMFEAQAAAGKENEAKGTEYLAANAEKEGVIVTPSGLQYTVLEEGTGPKPSQASTVVAHYRGTLIDGTEFDSSYSRNEPTEFPVGGVIKGWTEALLMMNVGSKWQLTIPGNLAYGPQGRPPTITPNAVLLFDIELVAIK
jgi:FKBP-type peptidyl-prolyl cis-trans isomerase FklB